MLITIWIFCYWSTHVHGFHAYNLSQYDEQTHRNMLCPDYFDATRPYSADFIDKLKLWPELMSPFDEKFGETLYGSKIALDAIWKNQNPENCSNAKYLVSGGWPYGFGSRILLGNE